MKNKIALAILFSLLIIPFISNAVSESEIQEAFTLNFLTPDTRTDRILTSNLIAEKLELVGIDVTNNIASWEDTGSRVWAYPSGFTEYDYIPTYDEGGFDIAFIGWLNLPWEPSGHYDTDSLYPSGGNYYQYSNPTYDNLLDNFLAETDDTLKKNYADQMQAILYEDLPGISLYYYSENSPLNGSFQELAINMKHPILGTGELTPEGTEAAARNVRKAISHAIPRDQIISDILDNEGMSGITCCHPNSVFFDSTIEPYEFNLTKAKEYLEKAGFGETANTGYDPISIFLISIAGFIVFIVLRRFRK